jgi:hypothetical protein
MTSSRKAFELPYLFGGASYPSMPDAQCNVAYGPPCCSICQGGFTDGTNCIDVPDGSCGDWFTGGLALGGGIIVGGFAIWAT